MAALQSSLRFPSKPPFQPQLKPPQSSTSVHLSSLSITPPSPSSSLQKSKFKTLKTSKLRRNFIAAAIEESKGENENQSEESVSGGDTRELTELGTEIKKAMAERKEENGEGDLWSGVAKEIKEIEWPAFRKVVGTTGVVLGVIAGSSVVLLTVNAVLAEFSDRIFAGKGVQDFFG